MTNRRSIFKALVALAALPTLAMTSIKAKATPPSLVLGNLSDAQWKAAGVTNDDIHYFIKKIHDKQKQSPNDAITRGDTIAKIRDLMEVYMLSRSILDYQIVCDDRNNPPSVVESGGLGLFVHWKAVQFKGTDWVSTVFLV